MQNEHRGGHDSNRRSRHLTQTLIDSLGFTSEQQTQLEKINEETDLKKDSLFELNEKCKELFTQELYAENSNKKQLDSLIKCISFYTEKFNQLRMDNMEKIRSNCK